MRKFPFVRLIAEKRHCFLPSSKGHVHYNLQQISVQFLQETDKLLCS